MENTTKELHTLRGELTLAAAVCINSLGVVLMLYSGAGISAISSVPFAFSEVLPRLTLGTWTYLLAIVASAHTSPSLGWFFGVKSISTQPVKNKPDKIVAEKSFAMSFIIPKLFLSILFFTI